MYKDIHSWVGIIAGLFLFIAFYCGAFTMFKEPLNIWAASSYSLPAPPPLERTQELIDKTFAQFPEAKKSYTINFETNRTTPARLQWNIPTIGKDGKKIRGKDKIFYAALDKNGQLITTAQNPSYVGKLIDDLHRQIGLPMNRSLANIFMGLVSLLYGIALVSGTIILLPSLIKDIFLIRIGKNVKRMWLDLHNVLGIFSLPFHIIMAFSAVVFAYHDYFYDTQDKVIYNSQLQKLWIEEEHHEKPADDAKPLSVLQLRQKIEEQAQGFAIKSLSFQQSPKEGLTVRVTGTDPRYVTRATSGGFAEVNPYNGQLQHIDTFPGKGKNFQPIVISFFALHFGSFGGLFVKWLYFLLGLSGAIIFYTGNLLWVESKRKRARREQEPKEIQQTKSGVALANLTVGGGLGVICGVSILLVAARYFANINAPEIYYQLSFYISFLICLLWAFIRGAAKAGYELCFVSAVATILIPITSLISFFNFGFGMIELVAIFGAILLLILGQKAQKRAQNAPFDSIWYKGK
jgi:uncharacterized iron-regulated membrane protein